MPQIVLRSPARVRAVVSQKKRTRGLSRQLTAEARGAALRLLGLEKFARKA
jgi:hypothetical protein